MKIKNIIKIIVAFAGAIVSEYLGGFDQTLKILTIFIFGDFATGILKAIVCKTLDSRICVVGCIKKLCYFLIVAIAFQLDLLLKTPSTIRELACYFFISTDGISILENMAQMGIPFPKFIKNILQQLNEKADQGEITVKEGEIENENI